MIGELGQSHMLIVGPGAEDDDDAEELAARREPAPAHAAPPAAQPRPAGGARRSRPDRARDRRAARPSRACAPARRPIAPAWRPGFVVTQIAGRPLGAPRDSARPLRPVEERFAIRRAAQRRLLGPPGTRVSIAYLDDRDRPGQRGAGARPAARARPCSLGHLPPLYPEVRAYEIGDVGVIAFNVFLLQPMLEDVKKAMARFVAAPRRAPSCWICAATRAARARWRSRSRRCS